MFPYAETALVLVSEWVAEYCKNDVKGRFFRLDQGDYNMDVYTIYRKDSYRDGRMV